MDLPELPADSWLIFLAGAVLTVAGAVARKVSGSMQRQGARLGELEQLAAAERRRRQQVETVLMEMGVALPYWPDDPPELRDLALQAARRSAAALRASAATRTPPKGDYLDSDEYRATVPYSSARHASTTTSR